MLPHQLDTAQKHSGLALRVRDTAFTALSAPRLSEFYEVANFITAELAAPRTYGQQKHLITFKSNAIQRSATALGGTTHAGRHGYSRAGSGGSGTGGWSGGLHGGRSAVKSRERREQATAQGAVPRTGRSEHRDVEGGKAAWGEVPDFNGRRAARRRCGGAVQVEHNSLNPC